MRELLLLLNLLFFGAGCLGGGSQRYPEVDPGDRVPPEGQLGPPDSTNIEEKKPAAEDRLESKMNELALNQETTNEETPVLAVRVLAVDSEQIHPSLPEPGSVGDLSCSPFWESPGKNMTQTKEEVIFHNKFFLSQQEVYPVSDPALPGGINPGRVLARYEFFVWPKEFGGTTVQSASYSHRVLRNGAWLGNFKPKPVWYDHVHQRWFIPFYDIFQDSDFYLGSDAHLEDLQVVILDLLLASGRRITYQIKFQVVGPLPEIVFRSLELPPLPDARVLGENLATIGWVVKKEELFNSSHHFLHLWLRPHPLERDAFFLKSYLRSSSFIEQVASAPIGPVFQTWTTQGALQVSEVRISYHDRNGRESRVTEVLSLDPEKWQGVSILPGETLVLEWLARTQLGVRDCSLPDAQHLKMIWTSQSQKGVAPSVSKDKIGALDFIISNIRASEELKNNSQLSTFNFQEVTNEWSVLRTEILGQWSRDLRVAFSFLSKEDATQSASASSGGEGGVVSPSWVREIASGRVESISAGEVGSLNPLQFSCQGVLR